METVGAIIPVYNEASSFYGNLPYISRMFTPLNEAVMNGILQKIIWVDDGSTDNTAGLIKKAIKGDQEILSHDYNRGKAAAFFTGFRAMQDIMDLILTLDADILNLTNEKITDFLSYMNPYLDMVVLEYAQIEGQPNSMWSGVRIIRRDVLLELFNPRNPNYGALMKIFNPEQKENYGYGLEIVLNRLISEEKTLTAREIPLTSRRPGGGQFDITKIASDFFYVTELIE
ncbi:MAG TPA: glycosyltransferase [Candidatus Woesearchaeota archaeon]|nr:glycosyltransferase [Candidatus Woesearchaeota archaeon]